ncbi:hypothetical protein Hanom_Chr15g01368591 [Helianthus anomalus]
MYFQSLLIYHKFRVYDITYFCSTVSASSIISAASYYMIIVTKVKHWNWSAYI